MPLDEASEFMHVWVLVGYMCPLVQAFLFLDFLGGRGKADEVEPKVGGRSP